MKPQRNGLTNKNIERIFKLFILFLKRNGASVQWCVNVIMNKRSIHYLINYAIPYNWVNSAFNWSRSKDLKPKQDSHILWSNLSMFWTNTTVMLLYKGLEDATHSSRERLTEEQFNEAVSYMLDIVEDPNYVKDHKEGRILPMPDRSPIDDHIVWIRTPQGHAYWERIHKMISQRYK